MTASASNPNREMPRYPMTLAFVVQMEDQAGPGQARLVGRVEHVSSGQSVEFDDPNALLRFIEAFVHPALSPPAEAPEGE